MSKKTILTAAAAVAILSGCAGFTSYKDVDTLESASAGGSAFNQALTNEYRELALYEQYEMFDYKDAETYAIKGLAAANGETVMPHEISAFHIAPEYTGVLTEQRARLLSVLNGGARTAKAAKAAHAQAMFDCWVEQQEENFQPSHILACRDEFMSTMAQLETPAAPQETSWVLFFDFDESDISVSAITKLDEIAAAYHEGMGRTLILIGYADTSGASTYNQGLSERRAHSVANALIARGVPANVITTDGEGETHLMIGTPDGQAERLNRRVVVDMH